MANVDQERSMTSCGQKRHTQRKSLLVLLVVGRDQISCQTAGRVEGILRQPGSRLPAQDTADPDAGGAGGIQGSNQV